MSWPSRIYIGTIFLTWVITMIRRRAWRWGWEDAEKKDNE